MSTVPSEYAKFLESKAQDANFSGFTPIWIPPTMFDFQQNVVEWNIRKGKSADLIDCGLGKTFIELVWGENVIRHTNKPVLDLTPLAVAQQTVGQAQNLVAVEVVGDDADQSVMEFESE